MRTSKLCFLFHPSSSSNPSNPQSLWWKYLLTSRHPWLWSQLSSYQLGNSPLNTLWALHALTIFWTFPSSFKEDFVFFLFASALACISPNHSWHLGLFFSKPSLQHFNRNYPLEVVSDSICHCRQHHCYFPRYLYGKQLTSACTIWQINGIIKT